MLVPINRRTKGIGKIAARAARGSRLASCLLLTAFRTRDQGNRAVWGTAPFGTIWGMARASAYQMLTAACLPDFLQRAIGVAKDAASACSFPALADTPVRNSEAVD